VVEAAGAVINVISLMILPGFVLRTLRVARPDGVLVEFALGVALAILTTVLNFGLDWHWVLSSLPDTVTLVAFVVAFRLAAELVILGYDVSRSHFAALAAVLGLITKPETDRSCAGCPARRGAGGRSNLVDGSWLAAASTPLIEAIAGLPAEPCDLVVLAHLPHGFVSRLHAFTSSDRRLVFCSPTEL